MADLTEKAAEALVGIITQDALAAALADDRLVLGAVGAEVDVRRFDVLRFGFRQLFAAVFTNNSFHNELRIEGPLIIEVLVIKDVEGAPLMFVEVEVGDVFLLSTCGFVITFGHLVRRNEKR